MKKSVDYEPKRKKHKKKVVNLRLRYGIIFSSVITSCVVAGGFIKLNRGKPTCNVNSSYKIEYDCNDVIQIPLSTAIPYSATIGDTLDSNDHIFKSLIFDMKYYHQIDSNYSDVYSGMSLTHELEDSIKNLCLLYDIPYQIVLTIGERESGGNWNNNGIISRTDDYGIFQINECNLEYIEENLGYTKEEIMNNPLKNTEACLFLLSNIIDMDDVNSVRDIFGVYNGWVNWKDKAMAVDYADGCYEILNHYFPDFDYSVDEYNSFNQFTKK